MKRYVLFIDNQGFAVCDSQGNFLRITLSIVEASDCVDKLDWQQLALRTSTFSWKYFTERLTLMPTESKSETPRTESAKFLAKQDHSDGEVVRAHFARQLEKELNEAHKNCIKQLDWEQLRAERNALAKENKVMRVELEQLLKELSPLSFTLESEYEYVTKDIKNALLSSTTTNLIVLTRNELIAEIEKMPCVCGHPSYDFNGNIMGSAEICEKHQWLARVKGGA